MEKPVVTPEQIASDRYYFATCKSMKAKPIGAIIRTTHDVSNFGKVHPSQRWHRVWQKTTDGWKYLGMQFGRRAIE